jgi:hypothetical protein
MGSKQRLLPFILKHLANLKFNSALDAFSGSGCVGYAIKQTGARVYANDFLNFCFQTARATVENNSTKLSDEDVGRFPVSPSAASHQSFSARQPGQTFLLRGNKNTVIFSVNRELFPLYSVLPRAGVAGRFIDILIWLHGKHTASGGLVVKKRHKLIQG